MSKTYPVRDNPPLTPSQLVSHDNSAATTQMPADMVRRLAQRRIYLSLADAKVDLSAHLKRVADGDGVWSLDLPAKSVAGLPGRTAELTDPESMAKNLLGKNHLDAFRPLWADHVFHPKLSGLPDAPPNVLRTTKGRIIRPHYGVFGSDDRKSYHPSGYPWQCIGRVFTWRDATPPNSWSFYGAGVLVGPRHVLTAAHIAPWGSPNWSMLFVPGYYDGASVVGSGANSWVSDFRSLAPGVDAFGPHDMSLLRLYDPLGDELGYFGAKLYDRSWQDGNFWTLVGYPSAVTSERPSFQAGIPVLANDVEGDAMALEHQGDSTYGNSGGPFFGVWPDGFPYVIGTDSGGVPNEFGGNNICAGGQAVLNLISYWRTNWP